MASESSGGLRLIDLEEAKARRARRGAGLPSEPTPTPRLDLDDRTRVGERPARAAERAPTPGLLLVSAAEPSALGQYFPLHAGELVIGRTGDVDVPIDDPGVSRRHAKVARRPGGGFLVEDLGSTNGTYVNGVAIRTAQLVEGDRVQMGTATELLFGVRREGDAAAEEVRLRQAVSAAGAGAFEWNVASGALQLSGAVSGGLGEASPGEDRADAWRHVLLDDRGPLIDGFLRALAEGARLDAECRLALARGGTAWVALAGMAFRDEDRQPVRIAGSVLDVTERKRAELELRRQALLFDALSDAVVAIGTDGAIVEWNGGAERLFGWARADALGRRPGALLHPDREDRLTERLVACARSGERYTEELTLRQRGGREVSAEVVAVPLRSPELGAVATVAVFRDVTERNRLQARLHLAERLAALGTLAAGVAHEINNPLTFVVANLEYVVSKLEEVGDRFGPERAEVDAALHDCQKGAHRIKQIVQDMRGCVVDRDAPGQIDVGEPIEFALRMADRKIRQRARLRRDLAQVPQVVFDEGRLGQVLLNLLVNAAEAIPPAHPDEHEVAVVTRHDRARNRVVVEISDTGSGIAPEDQARVFDPFFTTKPVGSGIGLGLFVCHGIVTSLGGEMGFRSNPGAGTTFWVSLPAVEPALRRARLLVVDDEPDVGAALRRCLEPTFEVVAVASGREALDRIAAGERFTVLLVDVAMRDMSGPELVARLEELAPDQAARAVLASGGYVVEGADGLPRPHPSAVLAKPFDLALVRDMVETALASESAA